MTTIADIANLKYVDYEENIILNYQLKCNY